MTNETTKEEELEDWQKEILHAGEQYTFEVLRAMSQEQRDKLRRSLWHLPDQSPFECDRKDMIEWTAKDWWEDSKRNTLLENIHYAD